MPEQEFFQKATSEIIPAILKIIEQSGISAQQATDLPGYIETAITQSNLNLLRKEPFRALKDCLR